MIYVLTLSGRVPSPQPKFNLTTRQALSPEIWLELWCVQQKQELKWQCCKDSASPLLTWHTGDRKQKSEQNSSMGLLRDKTQVLREIIWCGFKWFFYIIYYFESPLLTYSHHRHRNSSKVWINFAKVHIVSTFASGSDHVTLISCSWAYFLTRI